MDTQKAQDPATEISELIKLILMFHFQVASVQNLVQMTPVQDGGESTLHILALFLFTEGGNGTSNFTLC